MDPSALRFSPTHEWAHREGDVCTVGISQFAVEQLTDVVFVELPEVGQSVEAGSTLGRIESVKAVSDLFAPVTGEIVAINTPVIQDPSLITSDPYGQGWLVKIKVSSPMALDHLLDPGQYQKQIASESH